MERKYIVLNIVVFLAVLLILPSVVMAGAAKDTVEA